MKTEKIVLGPDDITLTVYLHDTSAEMPYVEKRPAVVICPGGGYEFCSDREGDPIALAYMGQGFNAFVVRYSLLERAAYPQPLIDLSKAMKIIREHADEWGVISDKIAVCGFSAGGHLAASLGTLWNNAEIAEKSGCKNGENRPNAMVLGYPVINTRSWMKAANCVKRLVGSRDYDETVKLLDCEKNVGAHTPPAFIFHTYTDPAVSVDDSLSFALAMSQNDRPFDLRVYSYGEHGMSLARSFTGDWDNQIKQWHGDSCNWLWRLFGSPEFAPFYDENARHRFNYETSKF